MSKQTNAALAARVFPVLISRVYKSNPPSLVYYEQLAEQIGMTGDSPLRLGNVLDQLAAWLKEQRHPDLTMMVINKAKNLPGCIGRPDNLMFPNLTIERWWEELMRVQAYDWPRVTWPKEEWIGAAYQRWRSSPEYEKRKHEQMTLHERAMSGLSSARPAPDAA
jgi:hypothetical protein